MRDADQPQIPALVPPSPRSSQQSSTRIPDLPRREAAPTPKRPAAGPAIIDNDERTPAEYVQMAQTAIAAGRLGAAIDFIDKGQTRLLDRSVALFKTFDPITDESIKQLEAAKEALRTKNRESAAKSLSAALSAMR